MFYFAPYTMLGKDYFVTFSYGQTHLIDSKFINKDCVVVISATSKNSAKKIAAEKFWMNYKRIYSKEEEIDIKNYPEWKIYLF